MTTKQRMIAILAACGTMTGVASAQPYVINLSGATLLENFLKAPASTNDFFDLDGDNFARDLGSNDQLAPFALPPNGGLGQNAQWWIVNYDAVGSVNGFQELVNFGRVFVTTDDHDDPAGINSRVRNPAYSNRQEYIRNGVENNAIFNEGNPGGHPVRSTTDGTYVATYSVPDAPSAGGVQIDAAPVDVPSLWAVRGPAGGEDATDNPGDAGYGRNPRRSVNKQGGTSGADKDNLLAELTGGANLNVSNPDANTIFDTRLVFAPVAAIVNYGTGYQQLKQSELRHLFATGRLPSGENLTAVTRDVGSGTHNAFINSIGLDPSFGVGENVGGLSTLSAEQLVGPNYIPGNKSASGGSEATVVNTRLGIAYSGAERGVNNGWLRNGRADVLAVQNDLVGGTEYSRPNIDEVLDNNSNGYTIGGPAIFAHFGDARSAPVSKGGDASNTNPDMRNVEAAAYLNNITLSVAAFKSDPKGDQSFFTPAEFLALNLILTSATDFIQSDDPIVGVPNPGLNPTIQEFVRRNNVLRNNDYRTFGLNSRNGLVPTRTTNVTYTDGVNGSQNFYKQQDGNNLTYGAALNDRNRIAYDFNGDGKRDINDTAEMLKAYRQRNGGPNWVAPNGTGDIAGALGTTASIEILGDGNSDGNFTAADIRYFADGLGVDPNSRLLSRNAAFTAVDTEWETLTGSNNFFGTTIDGGRPYTAGDSRADVAGGAGFTRGFAPIGSDGIINATDRNYILANFGSWSNLADAVRIDLSCDLTGDLVVDQADVDAIDVILGVGCPADFNGDGLVDSDDFFDFLNSFNLGDPSADFNGDGLVDSDDFFDFLNAFNAGC